MLRLQADEGWWLVTHPDHAHLAGEFASKWGNAQFSSPEPREHVLHGIYAHDDGWTERDAKPQITKQGRPAAFSTELVGTYSAFEEIDLAAYLAVRRNAVQMIAKEDPYAAILISMHTQNLLTDRADRSSIRPEHLPWLDVFLVEQSKLQRALRDQLISEGRFAEKHVSLDNLHMNFQLLQGCDNLSLLSCVDFGGGATLLHPFATVDGEMTEIHVERLAERMFRLSPYPLDEPQINFKVRARFVPQLAFQSAEELQVLFDQAPQKELDVLITA